MDDARAAKAETLLGKLTTAEINMKSSLCLIAILFFNCNSEKKETGNSNHSVSESIVLINIGSSTRDDIAKALNWLGQCKPKVVAINTVFIPFNYTKADTSLSNVIKSLSNVVLISSVNFDSLETSDEFFLQNSLADGVMGFSYNDEKIFHKLTMPVGDKLKWSFPFTVASYYEPGLASQLMTRTLPDTYYDVFIDRQIDQYFSIDINELYKFDCINLENKIILLGDLDSTTDDVIVLSKVKKQLNITIVLANIIENLLDAKLIKSKDAE